MGLPEDLSALWNIRTMNLPAFAEAFSISFRMNTLYGRRSSADPPTVVSRTADSCRRISRLLSAVYPIEACALFPVNRLSFERERFILS
jgi:hypothetical protein